MSVSAFRRYPLYSVPESLRLVAHQIECGDIKACRCVVILETEGDNVEYRAFGQDFTRAHAVGLCVAATKEILE